MLNKAQERELAYLVTIDEIQPIPGYDRVEHARVGGWWVIVQKDQFKPGDVAIYFEIDSKVPPDRECFAFLEKRNYKVKSIKMCKVLSQGLLMHPSDFGWTSFNKLKYKDLPTIKSQGIFIDKDNIHYVDDESRFLTKILGVTYADAEDNVRKANSPDKYKKMAQRHPNIFKKPWARWLMKHRWGRKIMFAIFGKKKDKRGWPAWVTKTDEERVQNMPWILKDDGIWIATEKIDGTSTTFTMKRGKFGKREFYVCSRNVAFDTIDKPCYYDTNVYWEMAKKYDMYNVLNRLLEMCPESEWVTIQGETYGAGVQKRDYSMKDHDLAVFNVIFSTTGRMNSIRMKKLMDEFNIPTVPILEEKININQFATVDDILAYADGNSVVDGKPREGIVFRSEDGTRSFKAVSNNFLLKYHQ
jgi:hypothetical protein